MLLISTLVLASSFGTAAIEPDESLDALLWRVGECVVDRRYSKAREFVLHYPVGQGSEASGLPLVRECNDILLRQNLQVSFLTLNYRYALASALVRRDYQDHGPAAIPTELTLPMPQELTKPMTEQQKRLPAAFRAARLYADDEAQEAALGECLVRAQPEAVRRWLVTTPGSQTEIAEAALLNTSFRNCAMRLGRNGNSFNVEVMRGPVALNYYRFANALSESSIKVK